MKTLRLIAVSSVFAVIFAISAFAQTTTPAGKIGLINTGLFDSKEGITKYVNAMNALDTEFKPDNTALQTLATKIQTLEKELNTLREQLSKPNSPIKPETYNAKLEEYDKLTREFKFKQEDAKARYERREQVVMMPIRVDIGKALDEFAKKNGFTLILDGAKLSNAGLILAFDEKSDVTKEFITFYNARPATAAATTATK